MVPTLNINRLIIKLGIEQLKKNKRLGIMSLCKHAKINIEYITEKDIAFNIAPCINAMGRIENPKNALSLLLTYYEKNADILLYFKFWIPDWKSFFPIAIIFTSIF